MIPAIVAAACAQQPKPPAQADGWRAPDTWVLCPGCGDEMVPPDTQCDECLADKARFTARAVARKNSLQVRFWRWLGLRD